MMRREERVIVQFTGLSPPPTGQWLVLILNKSAHILVWRLWTWIEKIKVTAARPFMAPTFPFPFTSLSSVTQTLLAVRRVQPGHVKGKVSYSRSNFYIHILYASHRTKRRNNFLRFCSSLLFQSIVPSLFYNLPLPKVRILSRNILLLNISSCHNLTNNLSHSLFLNNHMRPILQLFSLLILVPETAVTAQFHISISSSPFSLSLVFLSLLSHRTPRVS